MSTKQKNTMTNEAKYVVADAMAKDLKNHVAPTVLEDRKTLFGIVINTMNASGKTLQDVFGEEDAIHITNLIIQRLTHKFESIVTSAF